MFKQVINSLRTELSRSLENIQNRTLRIKSYQKKPNPLQNIIKPTYLFNISILKEDTSKSSIFYEVEETEIYNLWKTLVS